MKILKISGRNLASLAGDFLIDFDQPPLATAGLFAITGRTGAGKSTLLDALCLALFDRMPRLREAPGGPVGRAGEAEQLRLRGADPRSILRRGAGEGFAQVDFRGADGLVYRARWEVRRARNRPGGRFQPQSMSLRELGSGQALGDTKTQVLTAIEQRLGLNFEQFSRSVLLAQGDFAAFLQAPAPQRAALLERITGTGLYGRLSTAAYERAREETGLRRRLEERLQELQPLSAAERRALEARRQTHEEHYQRALAEQAAAQQALDWHAEMSRRRAAAAAADSALSGAEQAWTEAGPRRERLAAMDAVQDLRPAVQALGAIEAELLELRGGTGELRDELIAAESGLAEARGRNDRARQAVTDLESRAAALEPQLAEAAQLDLLLAKGGQRLATERESLAASGHRCAMLDGTLARLEAERAPLAARLQASSDWLEEHRAWQPLAEQWERWDAELQRFADFSVQAAEARGRLSGLETELESLQPQQDSARGELARAEAELEQAGRQLEQARRQAAGFDAEALAAEREGLNARWHRLQRLEALQERYRELDTEAGTLGQRLTGTITDLRDAERSLAGLAARRPLLEARLSEARDAQRRTSAARSHSVAGLRETLRPGEPCPVCGAMEHPWAGQAGLVANLAEEQDRRVEELQAESDTLQRELTAVGGRRELLIERRTDLTARQVVLQSSLADLLGEWRELTAALEPEAGGPDSGSEALGRFRERLQAREQALAAAEGGAREAARALAQCQEDRERLLERREAARDRVGNLSSQLERLAQERVRLSSEARSAADAAAGLRPQLAQVLAPVADGEAMLVAEPERLRRDCRRQVETYRATLESGQQARQRLDEMALQCRETQAAGREARQTLNQQAATVSGLEAELQQTRERRADLLDDRPVDEVRRELAELRHRAVGESARCQELLREAELHRQSLAEALRQAEARLAVMAERRDRGLATLEAELQRRNLNRTALESLLGPDGAWIQSERQALDALRSALEQARSVVAERKRLVAEHAGACRPELSVEQARAQAGQSARQAAQANQEMTDARLRLRDDDFRLERARGLAAELRAQEKRCQVWESLSELIGSASGNKFRTFAQSLTLDVLIAHANHHLRDLRRRYRLERVPGTSMDLQVIDQEMGDEARSVFSLSGGETFLVSLALALGLASLSSRQTQVESLFIDEGFGSLDPDALDVALSSLDELQALGRRVGVISHVPTVVERIGVQVRVEDRGGGRSSVRVTSPLAVEPLSAAPAGV